MNEASSVPTTELIQETCDVNLPRKRKSGNAKRKEIMDEKRQANKRRRKTEQKRRKEVKREERELALSKLTPEEQTKFLEESKEARFERYHEMLQHIKDCYEMKDVCYRVCINCSFDHKMTSKELHSLAKQICYCYVGLKNNTDIKIQYHISSFPTNKESEFYKHCVAFGSDNWKIHFHKEPYWEVFDSDQIVVLSPDAEEELENFEKQNVYIIGGLVDRTIAKNESYTQAKHLNLRSRKLPIKTHMPEITGSVLTINTVIDIMREWIRTEAWDEVLKLHIPIRRQGTIGPRGKRRQARREQIEAATSAEILCLKELPSYLLNAQTADSLAAEEETMITLDDKVVDALRTLTSFALNRIRSKRKRSADLKAFEVSPNGLQSSDKTENAPALHTIWPDVPEKSATVKQGLVQKWFDFLLDQHSSRQVRRKDELKFGGKSSDDALDLSLGDGLMSEWFKKSDSNSDNNNNNQLID